MLVTPGFSIGPILGTGTLHCDKTNHLGVDIRGALSISAMVSVAGLRAYMLGFCGYAVWGAHTIMGHDAAVSAPALH